MPSISKQATVMINPFLTFGYNGPAYFCDRTEETKRLTSLLTNGNHVALISPRRMGKTGLIKHCFSQMQIQKNYHLFFVDIYATRSEAEFTYKLGQSILSVLKSKGRKSWERFIQVVASLRTGISLDAMGQPNWNLEIGDIQTPQVTLDEIFQYLSKADKPCFVAIDEFQSIMDYPEKNVEALLRTHIQDCNNAKFVFSGSKRHMMNEIFSSPARPFYQSATILTLRPIPIEAYTPFIICHFESNGRRIDTDAIADLYHRFGGVTWYIQKICNEVFAASDRGDSIGTPEIDMAIRQVIDEKTDTFEDLMARLTMKQRSLLKGLASEESLRPTSAAFIKKYHLTSPSTVQRILTSMLDKDLISYEGDHYFIHDYFFKYWLARS